MHLIEIQDLSFAYPQLDALQDISLHMDTGEVLCLVGPNGCGKTTLLDHLISAHPMQKGKIFFEGKDFRKIRAKEMAKRIGYVPQSRRNTFPYQVLDFVLMGRTPYTGVFASPDEEDRQIALAALEEIGISSFQNRIFTQLSGGERQLVILARALAQKTPLLLMDEPTAHLDFAHELMVLETIVKMIKTQNLSVMMATHFPNHAFYLQSNGVPTRVAMMKQGKILEIGQPDEVLTVSNIETVFGVNSRILSIQNGQSGGMKTIVPVKTTKSESERMVLCDKIG
jgi:iron complex transport system ATP-binding protein